MGGYVLDGESELTVTKQPTEENKEEGYKIEAYDISLGEMHELDDFITIRIPYDTGYCEKDRDPARCVGAKYKNETTGEWEDVLFEVDAAANELAKFGIGLVDKFFDYSDRLDNAITMATVGAVILLMSVHILFWIDILKESLGKCRNE